MMKNHIVAAALVAAISAPLTMSANATADDGGCALYQCTDGGRAVPEMDAGGAALGLGLTLGAIAFIRDRKRRK